MANVRLHSFLGEVEPLADLAVHEAVRNELEHLDLAHRGLLLEFAHGRRERDHLGVLAGRMPCRSLVEATAVVQVSAQDVFTLGSVDAGNIARLQGLPYPQSKGGR